MPVKQKDEIIMAGVGGKGVLMAGKLLAQAAMSQDRQVVWLPSYSAAKRGGPCDCSIIISEDRIASPVISQADAVIIMDSSQLEFFEGRVRPGGILITESAGLKRDMVRDDITALTVPAVQEAVALGDSRVANLILLGIYIEVAKPITRDSVEIELSTMFEGKETLLALNREAFQKGLKLGTECNPHTNREEG